MGHMPSRQGFGMPQQGLGSFGGPQQQQGGFGGFGMPQQRGFGGFGGSGYYGMPQQQGLGSVGMQPQNQALQPQGMQAPLSQYQMQQQAQMMAGAQQAFNPYNSGQYNQPGPQGGSFMQNLGMFGMQPRMPQAPTTQQVGQEDPRMQVMRYMQRLGFGG